MLGLDRIEMILMGFLLHYLREERFPFKLDDY
jgi:hypothetical protein